MTQRVNLSLDEDAAATLQAAAAQRDVRPTTLAGQLIRSALLGGQPVTPGQLALPTPASDTTASSAAAATGTPAPGRTVPQIADSERAEWLLLDRGRAWRERMWDAAEQLRSEYPDLADLAKDGWHRDRFTRDGLLALAVWRTDLDVGAQVDPRLEHQFLAGLRDFKRMLEERAGHVGAPVVAIDRPADW